VAIRSASLAVSGTPVRSDGSSSELLSEFVITHSRRRARGRTKGGCSCANLPPQRRVVVSGSILKCFQARESH
jgi:hypothetical protein